LNDCRFTVLSLNETAGIAREGAERKATLTVLQNADLQLDLEAKS
jgi:hypothetical protein